MLGSLPRVAAVLLVGTSSMEEKDSFVVEQEDKPVIRSTDILNPPVDLESTVLLKDEVSQVRKHIYPR